MNTLLSLLVAFHLLLPLPQIMMTSNVRSSPSPVSIDNHTYYPYASFSSCPSPSVGGVCQITTSFVIPHTGDAVSVQVLGCWNGACSTAAVGSPTVTDGTNTYVLDSSASVIGSSVNVYTFVACNATAGTYTLNFNTPGIYDIYYARAESVTYQGANTTTCQDSGLSANNAGSSTALTVTTAGNVAYSNEIIESWQSSGGTGTNTGSCSTLDTTGTDNLIILYSSHPASGAPVTCESTSGTSSAWQSVIIGIRP